MKPQLLNQIKKSAFVGSFKEIDSEFIYSILLDIAWILLLVGISAVTASTLKASLSDLSTVAPELDKVMGQLAFEEPESVTQLADIGDVLRSAFMKLILTAIIAIISMIIVSAFLRSIVWSRIRLRKFDKTYLKGLFLLKLWWIPVWLAVIALIVMLFKPGVRNWLIGIIAIAYFHFTAILHSLFEKKKPILATVKKAFAIGIKKFRIFIIPYILATIILSIFATILYPISLLPINLIVLTSICVILFLIFAAWLRLFIFRNVKEIENRKT